jgi:polyphosphate kinase 2 (PPK2 family)
MGDRPANAGPVAANAGVPRPGWRLVVRLVVLQAMDAGGKDGTVNHVFSAVNPQGTVVGFKQPTPIELAHDFLWRVHPHAPGRGEVMIFNRSHYEDVLVPRVHQLIDKAAWTARYERIREFEAGLTNNARRRGM